MNFFHIKAMVAAIKIKNPKKPKNEKSNPNASATTVSNTSENSKLHNSR